MAGSATGRCDTPLARDHPSIPDDVRARIRQTAIQRAQDMPAPTEEIRAKVAVLLTDDTESAAS